MRGLLITHEHEWVFKLRHLFESLDVEDRLTHLEKYRRYQKKHFVNVWTIEDKDNLASVKDYVDTKVTNYNNKFFNMGLTLSNSIDYLLNDGVKWILKIIKTLFS